MSDEDKDALRTEAARHGVSVQVLLERRVFGRADAQDRIGGRTPRRQREELNLSINT